MSNLNIRVLDPPTHSRQFDANCGKIRYVSDPYMKIFWTVVLKIISIYLAFKMNRLFYILLVESRVFKLKKTS